MHLFSTHPLHCCFTWSLDHYYKNVPVGQSLSWDATWESTTFHDCQDLEKMTSWEETATPWICSGQRSGCGAAEGGGREIHHQMVSIHVCKRALLWQFWKMEQSTRWHLKVALPGYMFSWEFGSWWWEQVWGWRAEQGWTSLGPDSEHSSISGCFLTGLKDLASAVPEWEILTVISLFLYVFKGLFSVASGRDLVTQREGGRGRGRAEAGSRQ